MCRFNVPTHKKRGRLFWVMTHIRIKFIITINSSGKFEVFIFLYVAEP